MPSLKAALRSELRAFFKIRSSVARSKTLAAFFLCFSVLQVFTAKIGSIEASKSVVISRMRSVANFSRVSEAALLVEARLPRVAVVMSEAVEF